MINKFNIVRYYLQQDETNFKILAHICNILKKPGRNNLAHHRIIAIHW